MPILTYLSFVAEFSQTFLLFFVTDVIVTFFVDNHWMLLADVIASWLLMADVISHCGRCISHIICLCKPTIVGFVADVIATLLG